MGKPWLKSYAYGVKHNLDFEEITMSDTLTRTAEKYPDVAGLIYFKTKISYKVFDQMVNKMANALIDLGVQPGDKVSLL